MLSLSLNPNKGCVMVYILVMIREMVAQSFDQLTKESGIFMSSCTEMSQMKRNNVSFCEMSSLMN